VIGFVQATANPDGSVIHVVQSGQTLTGIANVYEVELSELLKLNNLTLQSIIQPGDRILVVAGQPGTGTLTLPAAGSGQADNPAQPASTSIDQAFSKTLAPALTATLPAGDLLLAATGTAALKQPSNPPGSTLPPPNAQTGQEPTATSGLAGSLVSILVVAMLTAGALFAAWAWWKDR
jgi:LysM repeat protein